MFGAGWTEMLIIGVVALVVIGPKDLPIVMRKIGRMVGTVRRMGNEFQRELNKTTGLDQITDLRRSITEPLRQTSQEIAAEFNKVTATGIEPSGLIKPTDPKVESVYDQIAATSGLPPVEPAASPDIAGPTAAAAAMTSAPPVMKPLATAPEPSPAPAEASLPPPVSPAKPKRATRARAATAVEAPKRARKPAAAKPVAAKAPAARKSAPKAAKVDTLSQEVVATASVSPPAAVAAKPKRTRSAAKPAPAMDATVPADAVANGTADTNAEKA